MSLMTPHELPYFVEVGVDTSIAFDVYSDAQGSSTQQTATVGTVALWDGDEAVQAAAAATSLGPPATYTVLGSLTTGRAVSDRGLAVWTLTLSGTARPFHRALYYVRRAWHPGLKDEHLYDRHSELEGLLAEMDDVSSYEKWRTSAANYIQRDLLKKGRRPHLIFDGWGLHDAHLALTLHFIFRDWGTEFGQGNNYKSMAKDYRDEYIHEWSRVEFRYDDDDTGTITDGKMEAGSPAIMLTQGRPRGRLYRRRRLV